MKTIHTDVLILGGGPAGIQAARLLKTRKPDIDVIMLRPETYSVIYCAIPYAIEGTIEMDKIAKSDELVTGVGAQLLRTRAIDADLANRLVNTEDGRRISYNTLLIVTGARPAPLPVPGSDLPGVNTVKMGEDAEAIARLARETKRAVVVGAGAIGLEQAQAFRHLGLEVHLVEIAGHPLAAMIDGEIGKKVTNHLLGMGIKLHLAKTVRHFLGTERVESVELSNDISLDVGDGFVVTCTGMKPNTELFAGSGLEMNDHGIIVDARMRTSLEGVFAAGDVTTFISAIDGEPIGGKLATNAVPMAKVAALNILGASEEYAGFYNGAVTCAGEWRVGGTGFSEAVAMQRGMDVVTGLGETTSRFPMMPGASEVLIKLIADSASGRIIGGQAWGKEAVAERIDTITMAVTNRMTARELAQFSYSAQPWQTFFPARNAIVMAAEEIVDKLK